MAVSAPSGGAEWERWRTHLQAGWKPSSPEGRPQAPRTGPLPDTPLITHPHTAPLLTRTLRGAPPNPQGPSGGQ